MGGVLKFWSLLLIGTFNFVATRADGPLDQLIKQTVDDVIREAEALSTPFNLEFHPLDQLSHAEIEQTVKLIRETTPGIPWIFSWITLQEPLKSDLLPLFLKNEHVVAESAGIPRLSLTILTHPTNASVFEVIINLDKDGAKLVRWIEAAPGTLATQNLEFPTPSIEIILADESVKKRLKKMGIVITNTTELIPDAWAYGYKGDKPQYKDKLIVQVFLTLRKFPLDNYFAHPMPFIVIIDMGLKRVVDIEDFPIQGDDIDTSNRNGEKVPDENYNFDPALQPTGFYRNIHPINQEQPNGANFKLNGNEVEWQKFKMRIGYNSREGIVLHHVSYNDGGHVRPLIYRAALSEIFVPYGDPRPPFYREMAFDEGQYGLGQHANELQPQIDCRGEVAFLDGIFHDHAGVPVTIKRAICIFEEDVGILWKKTDLSTGRSTTVRAQRLGITLTSTLSNYDYRFSWFFYQDASIQVEVKLTGIVHSVFNVKTDAANGIRHNTRVAPNVHAGYHQHFFVFRIDAEFDGRNNTVSTFDAHPISSPSGSPENPYGNGFTTTTTPLKTAAEGRTKVNRETGRSWLISCGDDHLNPTTGTPKAWKLVPAIHSSPPFLSKSSPMHAKNSFVDYDVWVTRYQENQLYPGGFHLNNSGLKQWVEENPDASIKDTDIVLWHVFGITHIPRVEEYPVMPAETTGFWLKPFNFFTLNPSLDVPPLSAQKSDSSDLNSEQ